MPVFKISNKLVYGTRVHRNTWGRVSQAWKRVQKRDNKVWNLCNIRDIWHGCQQMCRQIMAVLYMYSGFPAKILEQTIVTSLYDVMRVSHAILGVNYKRRAWLSLGLLLLSSGCFNTSILVFSKPQTLYFGCLSAPQVESISGMHSVVCFSISMHPDLFGRLWVIVTSFIWR